MNNRSTMGLMALAALLAGALVWVTLGDRGRTIEPAHAEADEPAAVVPLAAPDAPDRDADASASADGASGDGQQASDAADAPGAGSSNDVAPESTGETGDDAGDGAEASANDAEPVDVEDGADADAATDEPAMVSIAFRNLRMQQLASFLTEHFDKPVLIDNSIQNTRLTIVFDRKLPLGEAMMVIRFALHRDGVVIVENRHTIELRSLENVHQAQLPLLGPGDPLNEVVDDSHIVQKVFAINHYDVMRVQEAVLPLLPEHGHMTADPNTRKLMVTASVAELRRMERVIGQLDVETASDLVEQIIELEHADATWVVAVLRVLLSTRESDMGQAILSVMGGQAQSGRGSRGRPTRGRGGSGDGEPNVVTIERDGAPVMLMPEVTRNWIVAVAPPVTMRQIERWVKRLDVAEAVDEEEQRLIDVRYANVEEVAQQISQVIEATPTMRDSVHVQPFVQANKLLVVGSRHGRDFVRSLLAELDVEGASQGQMETIELKHADAEEVAQNIEELFSQRVLSYRSRWGESFRHDPSAGPRVQVVRDTRRNAVTVVTDAATLERVKHMIETQWDLPLSDEAVQPMVRQLEYADPMQVRELLEDLFSRRDTGGFNWLFGGGSDTTPVGPLFGQFSFQTLPDSNMLVVTTKNAENYRVIERLIDEIDQPQEAGLPQIIELNHAYAEDLAGQLNAMLAERGTLAEIAMQYRGLQRRWDQSTLGNGQQQGGQQGGGGDDSDRPDPGRMRFWWQQSRDDPNRRDGHNLVGKIRIVPVHRRNALMVMAPPAYGEPIADLIRLLDEPGQQVVIHAVIAEVRHEDAMTLGLRLASDPSTLADPRLADQSIRLNATQQFNELFWGTFNIGEDTFGRGVLNANVNVSALIQLLMRDFNLNVLSEPKLYTADNQEAVLFDGNDVSILTDSQTTAEGAIVQSFDYRAVGTFLGVRPHITHEGNVALNINLEVSRIVPGGGTTTNPLIDRRETTTRVVVQDGQTVMLSGIVRQQESRDIRKLPILGDIPLLGALFRSRDESVQNHEMLVFITPQLITTTREGVDEAMEPYRLRLQDLRDRINPFFDERDDEADEADEADENGTEDDAEPWPTQDAISRVGP